MLTLQGFSQVEYLFGASAYYSICKAAFLSYRRLKNEMKNNPYQAFFSPIKS